VVEGNNIGNKMGYKPLFLNPDDTVTLRILPPSATGSLDTVHYIKGFNEFNLDIEGEWIEDKEEVVVINRFSFLDLEE
jgi:hypothetical protein